MNTPRTLAAYAAALAVVFGAAAGTGRLVGPVGAEPTSAAAAASADSHGRDGHGSDGQGTDGQGTDGQGTDGHGASAATATGPGVGGLAVASDGYALHLATPTARPGERFRLALTLTGPDGEPVRDYEREHDKELHLVVVRRDLTGFRHLHPTRDDAGRWSLPLVLDEPGTYKVVADFTPAGRTTPLALAADLVVPGNAEPRPLPAPARSTEVDGFTVELDGELTAGRTSDLAFTVRRDGRPVTDLDPYLGAYGHLVVLRAGDAAYLHVHPEASGADGTGSAGPEVVFGAEVPAAGTHRLFLDFSVDGVVRTAELTAQATTGHADEHATGHGDAEHDEGGHP